MNLVTEAVAIAFIDDITGGELEFDYEPAVTVSGAFDPGQQGFGRKYTYSVDQLVPGLADSVLVDIDVNIEFSFPGRAPFFSFTPEATQIGIQNMQVNVGVISGSSNNVEMSVEANNPVVTLNLGAEIDYDDEGYISTMAIWSNDSSFESNVRQVITQGSAEIVLETTGTITELAGDLYFGEVDSENSQIIYNAEHLKARATLDGVLQDESELP